MWKQVLEYGKQIISQAGRLQRVEEEVKDLRVTVTRLDRETVELSRKLDALLAVVQHLNARIDHKRENSQHEQENLRLRLENTLLRFERRLPPGTPPNELGTEQS